jgi:hypothetical protein
VFERSRTRIERSSSTRTDCGSASITRRSLAHRPPTAS